MKLTIFNKVWFWKLKIRRRLKTTIIITFGIIVCVIYIIRKCVIALDIDSWFYRYSTLYSDFHCFLILIEQKEDCQLGDIEGGSTPFWMQQLQRQANMAPILGYQIPKRRFLSIGISTVYRKQNYLEITLQSIIFETFPDERENTVVIIYLADSDLNKRQTQMNLISTKFHEHIESGFIQVIESTSEIYPSMELAMTKLTFNDTADRVKWRVKQVVDFCFLFSYIKSQAEYHIVLEDDVVVAPQFINAIEDFVDSRQNSTWTALQFSQFTGIGLLFRATELPKLIEFLLLFYQGQPVDLLMRKYIQIVNGETEIMRRVPSLFQHIGIQSSLTNKIQNSTDISFGIVQRRFRNQNPKIKDIRSTMQTYLDFSPAKAYLGAPGFFWGIPGGRTELFEIIFLKLTRVSRVIIVSGMSVNELEPPVNPIDEGQVEVSSFLLESENGCREYTVVGRFVMGEFDATLVPKLSRIQCLRLAIRTERSKGIIIREIEILE